MLIPATMKANIVWLLKKSLYGLKQSPRCFYNKLDSILKSKNYTRVRADYGIWTNRETLHEVILIVHVDDMLVMGTKSGIYGLKSVLSECFEMKWMGPLQDSLFVGVHLRRVRDNILLSQERYAKAIVTRFGLEDANECSTIMDKKEDCTTRSHDTILDDEAKQNYQSAIGSLIYLILRARPNLAFPINKLAQYSSAPTMRHWNGVKRIIRLDRKSTV